MLVLNSNKMELSHRTRTTEKSGAGSGLFMLSNKKGGYALLGDTGFSHFCGVHFLLPDSWEQFKTVDAISLDKHPDALTNKFFCVERQSGESVEEFFFFGKSLYYDVRRYSGKITIDLDMRRLYDSSDDDRHYKIYFESGCVIVEYAHHGETFYLAIRGVDSFTLLNEWLPRHYAYDELRGGLADRWVYRALQFDCVAAQKLTFTFGTSKDQLLADAAMAWDEWDIIRSRLKGFAHSVKTTNGVAYSTAVFALESLVMSLNGGVNATGVFAGLPWFFHFWARDELISLQGLVLAEKYALAKDVLWRYVLQVQVDGRLPNRFPGVGLGSADAVGWLWKRLGDLLTLLDGEGLLWDYFSFEELQELTERLERSLHHLKDNYFVDGLIFNKPQETWMDTHGGVGDVRTGARVEVQALTLASLQTFRLLCKLTKKGGVSLKDFEQLLLKKTREVLFVDGVLRDGFDHAVDFVVRPNVFIAAYVYPALLSKREWVSTFKFVLDKLWLQWGGLSSIAKDDSLFVSQYTGENNKSYHRGDSWYWVNNVAALAMHRIAPREFLYYVQGIKLASVHDLLWQGVAGHCSEISSAHRQDAVGCLAQAWSAATLIELLDAVGE